MLYVHHVCVQVDPKTSSEENLDPAFSRYLHRNLGGFLFMYAYQLGALLSERLSIQGWLCLITLKNFYTSGSFQKI